MTPIQEEWESVIAEYQDAHGAIDPAVAKIGEECFWLGCAFIFQLTLDAFSNRSYQSVAIIKEELLAHHTQGAPHGQAH